MPTRMVVKSIGPWSVFKVSLAYYYLIFLIQMILLGLTFLIIGIGGGTLLNQMSSQAGSSGLDVGQITNAFGGSLLVTYLLLFVGGVITGPVCGLFAVIGSFIYNLIGWMTGGIELRLLEK